MKRMFFVSVLILAVSLTTFARKFVAEGKTYTSLGNYRIEIADNPVTLMGKDLKAFIIAYENSNMEVTVAFDKNRRGMTYYVLAPALNIKYVCTGSCFGVAKLNDELAQDGYRTSSSALDRTEYFHQKVLASNAVCDLDNSKLIAAYFPMLINNLENFLASR